MMTTYVNAKGQSQSPHKTFAPTATFRVRQHKYTKPTPYVLTWGYGPIDTTQCQCPAKFKEHTTFHDTLFDLLRCDRPATTVAVENAPRASHILEQLPPEGHVVAYSCCDECREHILTSHGPDYAKFTPIEK